MPCNGAPAMGAVSNEPVTETATATPVSSSSSRQHLHASLQMSSDDVKVMCFDAQLRVCLGEVVHAILREAVAGSGLPKRHRNEHCQMLHVLITVSPAVALATVQHRCIVSTAVNCILDEMRINRAWCICSGSATFRTRRKESTVTAANRSSSCEC